MNLLIHRIAFRISDAAKNWTIVKNKFLLPVKPKRAQTSYILFSNERRPHHTGSITEVAAKIGAEWKQLTPQQKQKYIDEAKKLAEKHQSEIADYEAKYVEPFKTVTSTTLAIKNMYANMTTKPKDITEGASIMKEYFSKRTQQEKKKFQAQAQALNQKNAEIQKNFIIPEPEFKTQRAFINHTLRERNQVFSELSEKEQEKVRKQYQTYIEKHNKTLEKFAKRHGLTLQNLQQIIKLHQRRLRKEQVSEKTVNSLASPEAPKKRYRLRRVTATTGTTTGAKRTVAKRATTRKTGASKTGAKRTTTRKTATTKRTATTRKVAAKRTTKTVGKRVAAKKA